MHGFIRGALPGPYIMGALASEIGRLDALSSLW